MFVPYARSLWNFFWNKYKVYRWLPPTIEVVIINKRSLLCAILFHWCLLKDDNVILEYFYFINLLKIQFYNETKHMKYVQMEVIIKFKFTIRRWLWNKSNLTFSSNSLLKTKLEYLKLLMPMTILHWSHFVRFSY